MTKELAKKNFDYSVVDTNESVIMPDRWVYIFGMENEGDMFGGLLGDMFGGGLNDLYKIGTTINPIRRWRQVQVHSPWELRVFAVIPGGFDMESIVHRGFDEYRTRGEWFNVPRHMMKDLIEELENEMSIGKELFPSLPWACITVESKGGAE